MIEDIVLNPREEINGPRHGEDGVVWLQYPPAIILFHPFHSEFAGVIVDIRMTKKLSVTPFAAYVALSYSRGRETVRLLHDFDDTIFTWHPSHHLHLEDEYLE